MLIFLSVVASITINIFFGSYATVELWGWFIVPLGIKSISYVHAIGISLLLSAFFLVKTEDSKKDGSATDVALRLIMASLVRPAALLGIGWVTHCFM